LSNRKSSSLLWKKYDIVVSLNTENKTKVAKLTKDFDIPKTTMTTVLKNKDKMISHFFS